MSPAISDRHPVAVVVGTRPEAIKLAPVIAELRRAGLPATVLSTGQHREMLGQVLELFSIRPDRDLDLMRPDQSLAALSAGLLERADSWLAEAEPGRVVVQGDTTTVAMVALAAFYRRVPVAHVEAGLRTRRRYDPFPEELNRTLLGTLADLHFAPTPGARDHLLAEGVDPEAIHVVGNTVVDALRHVERELLEEPLAELGVEIPAGRRLVLVTGHRRESFGAGFRGIFEGLARIAGEHPGTVEVVYPVHLNPNVRRPARERLAGIANVQLIEPVDYRTFVRLMLAAELIVTDSGGVQEEAAALGVPVLVTRATSERPEAIEAGVAELVGTDPDRIATAARRLLDDPAYRASRAVPSDVFGDGRAAQRIVSVLAADARA
jgi:UDP-N-acetylglucosamine 2-epimerase (non-hydrolysing)